MLGFLKRMLPLLALASPLAPAFAETPQPLRLCESAKATLKSDSDLADAVRAAYGQLGSTTDEACLYPLQTLRYADVDVLLTKDTGRDTGCEGCAADLSATVLRRVPGGFKKVRTFENFGKTGSSGAIASASPIAIGGDDGVAIEAGGMAQGYLHETLELYAFRKQGLVRLDSGAPLFIQGDNTGAQSDDGKATVIDSAWSLANNELVVDYRIVDKSGKHDTRAVWTVGETQLTLKSGGAPKEMGKATGAE